MKMLTKTKIAFAAALIIGTASAALASDHEDQSGGFQVQTWQDIAKSRRDIQNQIRGLHHKDTAVNAYGSVASQEGLSQPRKKKQGE